MRDREAVRTILEGEPSSEDGQAAGEESSSLAMDRLGSIFVGIDRRVAIALSGAVLLVVLFRIIPFPAVFRGGDVVLSGNDPYAYRYVVHQLLARSANPLDLSMLSSLPSGIAHGEPLMVATLWWVSALFGGASAAGGASAVGGGYGSRARAKNSRFAGRSASRRTKYGYQAAPKGTYTHSRSPMSISRCCTSGRIP